MVKVRRVLLTEYGGPEKLQLVTEELAAPGVGEVQLKQTALGFNFIDTYQRSGLYPLPLPTGLGHEAVGIIEEVGPGVEGFAAGERVAYINAGIGAYADYRNVAAERLVKVPAEVSDEEVAAVIFKGMTAQYLLKRTHAVKPAETIIVHAAAGGVGQVLCRWAKALGATVIGTAGSEEKCRIAEAAGANFAVDYSKPDWTEKILAATGGRKADVVYDSVGKDTFLHSLDLTAPFGLVVLFGSASGPAPSIAPELLNKKGCLFLTRPSIFPHNADPARLRENAADLFAAINLGYVHPAIGQRFALDEIAEAHRQAESRATQGATVIIP